MKTATIYQKGRSVGQKYRIVNIGPSPDWGSLILQLESGEFGEHIVGFPLQNIERYTIDEDYEEDSKPAKRGGGVR